MPILSPPSGDDQGVSVAYDFDPMPRVERGVRRIIVERVPVPDLSVGTSLPTPMRVPFVRLGRVAGQRLRLNDYPTLDVESFGATYADAASLAERIDAVMFGFPLRGGDLVIDSVTASVAPVELPWDDATVRRFLATYRLSVRR